MYFYIEYKDGNRKPIVVESSCPMSEVVRDYYDAEVSRIPYPLSLCISPRECKGKTSCPRARSCSE